MQFSKRLHKMTLISSTIGTAMKIICDFDGTTAVNDVGNLLFRTFADARCFDIVRSWKDGKINSRQCLEQECAITNVSKQELTVFSDSQELDRDFPKFVRLCHASNIEVEIASDGLDFYIRRALKKYDLESIVPVKSNVLKFVSDNRIAAGFPYFEKGCGTCGNCKGYHVRQARETHERVAYIGDGLSDRCGAEAADMVFAKRGRDLIRYCLENDIPHCEYDDFAEILRGFKVFFK